MNFDDPEDLVHQQFHAPWRLDLASEVLKIAKPLLKEVIYEFLAYYFSQFNANLIAATDEIDFYKPITKLNSMVQRDLAQPPELHYHIKHVPEFQTRRDFICRSSRSL